jgi:copper resistance protein C
VGAMRKMALLSLIAIVVLGAPAFGHAKLLVTAPAADAQVTGSPVALTLTFNEGVRLSLLKLTIGGHDIPLDIDRAAATAVTVTVKVPTLAAGKYDVQWTALTPSDGHVVKGSYSFSVL